MGDLFQQLRSALADRYQLEDELGRGGMAMVYRARDPRHQRMVAIKVLHPDLANAVGQERFLREIRFASELTHPHILPLLDSGSAQTPQATLPFFVMPYVEGESLRARLTREKQLPLADALEIARDVATALAYAHGRGVVHRDIKPENILLAGSRAMVADFGIARAINRSADPEILTSSGLAVGTPAYMSPEQASADAELDGRSDIYSLGCVLYEMLGGGPPFSGASANAILARHRIDAVPSLRIIRPTVTPAVELAIMKSLQKVPADRFQTAEQFAAALAGQVAPSATPLSTPVNAWSRQRPIAKSLLGVGLLAAIGFGVLRSRSSAGALPCSDPGGTCALDTTRLAILSVAPDPAQATTVSPAMLLRDAIAQWSGITLVDPIQVQESMGRRPVVRREDWRRVADDLGAGRYIRVDAMPMGDSVRVHAVLYDTRSDAPLADQVVRVASQLTGTSAGYNELAKALLFRAEGPHGSKDSLMSTSSVPARQAYARGHQALAEWNLVAADTAFDAAGRFDPQYAEAFLWLALVRAWSGNDATTWQSAAERAAAGRGRLSRRDRSVADAILAQSRGNAGVACPIWKALTRTDPHDFVAWYGSADCQSADSGVLRDQRSPSGWRFRSSYHSALRDYQQAFRLLPSIHRALRGGSFVTVRRLLKTSGNDLRLGSGLAPDTGFFVAYPTWQGDSLGFLPFPIGRIGEAARNPGVAEAVQHQRELFHDVARSWVAEFPRSSPALEALAVSLEMLGSPAALDTLRLARTLATGPEERLRLGAAEVWLRVRMAIPGDEAGLVFARALADSLLGSPAARASSQPRLLAALAMLLGRGEAAVTLSRHPAFQEDWSVPPVLAFAGPALLLYSAMGGPADSLKALENRVERIIDNSVSASERSSQRLRWLTRSATLAFPEYRFTSTQALAHQGDYLLDAFAALERGDTAAVRGMLADLQKARQYIRPEDRSPDGLLPEANLWMALGDTAAAAAWLEPTLTSLTVISPDITEDPVAAAALIRILALRSHIAYTMGDSAGARLWANPVTTLWSGADSFLIPRVGVLRQFAR